MPPTGKPDAVLVPVNTFVGSFSDRLIKHKNVFRVVFGCDRVRVQPQGEYSIDSAFENPDGTEGKTIALLFPIGHPFEKKERYDAYVAIQHRTAEGPWKAGDWELEPTPLKSLYDKQQSIKFLFAKPDPYPDFESPKGDLSLIDFQKDYVTPTPNQAIPAVDSDGQPLGV